MARSLILEHLAAVRVKGGMSLRNGMSHGLRDDIIMRNLIYGKWHKEKIACLGLSLIPVKERERVSGTVSNERFVNSCLANSPSVYIYTVICTL